MSDRFTSLVGCELPIQCAAMSGIATAPLAAAVSNAGGLGMLGVGRRGAPQLAAMIDECASLTDRPVGAGFIVEFLDRDAFELAAERLAVVELFWGWPDATLVPDGVVVGWQVGTVDEARAAIDAGCRYVVAQGVEGGGHVRGETELDELLPAVRNAVDDSIAVIAAGGIGTAADVRRALERGADAVRIGTRFVATHESTAHDRYVELLSAATDHDTELSEAFWVGWPEAAHRVLTSAVEASGDGPDVIGTMPGPDERRKVPRFFVSPPTRDFDGLIDAMALYAGVGSTGAVTGRMSVADVIAELLAD
jgi:nitronate monooxygenase